MWLKTSGGPRCHGHLLVIAFETLVLWRESVACRQATFYNALESSGLTGCPRHRCPLRCLSQEIIDCPVGHWWRCDDRVNPVFVVFRPISAYLKQAADGSTTPSLKHFIQNVSVEAAWKKPIFLTAVTPGWGRAFDTQPRSRGDVRLTKAIFDLIEIANA